MSRIEPITPSQTDPATAQTLAAVQAKLGMVPKLFSTLAHSPAALGAYLGLSDTLSGGRLNARQREIVALAVAQANACEYCLSAHTLMGKGNGLTESQMIDARQGSAADPLENAIATLAMRLARQRGVLSDAEFAAARADGLDDGLVLEVVAHVALNVLTNYVNHVAGTEVDFPRVRVELAMAA